MYSALGITTQVSTSHSASSLRPLVPITRSSSTHSPPTDEYALDEEPSSFPEPLCRFLAFMTQQVAEGKDDAQGTYEHFSASSK